MATSPPATQRFENWGGSYSCRPVSVVHPETEEEIRAVLASAAERGQTVKVVGALHSFSDIAMTENVMVSLDRLTRVLATDATRGIVTVEAGITLEALTQSLDRRGLAMPVLGEVSAQSIAGAISTGTHGTGARVGNIAAAVTALRVVLADGSVVEASAEGDLETFQAVRVGLGALGIVSTVTLQCVPAFNLRTVVERRGFDEILDALPELVDTNDHVDVIWFPHTSGVRLRRHNRSSEPAAPRRPVRAYLEDRVLENGVFGMLGRLGAIRPSMIPALNRFALRNVRQVQIVDRSFRRFLTPRQVRYVEMEYAVPRAAAADAIRAIRDVLNRGEFRLGFPIQARFVAADEMLLSPSSGRESCYLGVHEFSGKPFEAMFREVEAVLTSFEGRPHWGKVHYQSAETLRPRYPNWDRYQAVRARLDPAGRFRNAYLDRVLGPV